MKYCMGKNEGKGIWDRHRHTVVEFWQKCKKAKVRYTTEKSVHIGREFLILNKMGRGSDKMGGRHNKWDEMNLKAEQICNQKKEMKRDRQDIQYTVMYGYNYKEIKSEDKMKNKACKTNATAVN